MGQLVVKLAQPVSNVADILGGRRKRKRSIDSLQTNSEESNSESQSPKKYVKNVYLCLVCGHLTFYFYFQKETFDHNAIHLSGPV